MPGVRKNNSVISTDIPRVAFLSGSNRLPISSEVVCFAIQLQFPNAHHATGQLTLIDTKFRYEIL
jgi:hypothetical protein